MRLIRRDEEQGETGFTLSEVTENQLKAKIPALEERGLKLENRITIADF